MVRDKRGKEEEDNFIIESEDGYKLTRWRFKCLICNTVGVYRDTLMKARIDGIDHVDSDRNSNQFKG